MYAIVYHYFEKYYKSKTLDSKVDSTMKIESKDCLIRYTWYIGFPGTKLLIQICIQLSISWIKTPKLNQKRTKLNQKWQKSKIWFNKLEGNFHTGRTVWILTKHTVQQKTWKSIFYDPLPLDQPYYPMVGQNSNCSGVWQLLTTRFGY
jgi:hypothetical protein